MPAVEDAPDPTQAVAAALSSFPRAFDLWENETAHGEHAQLIMMSGNSSNSETYSFLYQANFAREPKRYACGGCAAA